MIGPYLFVSNDGSLESRGLVVYGALIAVALLCSLWALRRKDWLWVVIPLVVPALSAMRVLGWPIVSARVFPFSMAALSVLGLVNYSLKPCYEFERWLTLLECRRDTSAAYDPRAELVVIAAHVVLLSVVLAQFPALSALPPPVWALVTIGVCLMPQIVMSIRRRLLGLSVGLLAPLALVYVVAGVRLFLTYTLGWALLPYAPGQPLDIGSALLTTENVALAVATYIVLMQLAQGSSNRQAWASGSARLLLGMSVIWAVWETIGSRTSGVTATDPYAYAQMAVDWVRRGTPVHEFPLFETITKLDIPYFAAVHQGYHLPINTALQNLRDAPSVWPAGASLFLAAGYWLFGEPGLYLVTPLFGLLSLALVWSLARRLPARYPTLLAALAVTLLATSYEQVDRLLVPMADVPAQFFSMLAIGIALYLPMTERSPDNLASATRRIGRRLLQSPAWCGALAGISLGFAYWIRHTQILLAVPVVLAVLLRRRSMSRQAQRMWLVALCIGAGLTALPDLFYHQQVFGGFLTFESEELQTFSPDVTGLAFKRLWDDFALGHEFGFILPLTVLGAIQMARARIRAFAVMLAWVVVPLAFHLFYPALRLRDLLPETPPLVLWTAWGAADLLGADWQPNAPQAITRRPIVRRLLAVAGIVFALVSLSFRTQTTVARSLTPHRAGFGYLSAEERTVFDSIGQLTPQDSVIMASLHSGAIDLYAHRLTIRPQVWTGPQLNVFLAEMNREGRAVYFLYDSPSLRDHLYWLMQGGRLERVAAFGNLTFFGEREAESSTLYRVVPARAPAP